MVYNDDRCEQPFRVPIRFADEEEEHEFEMRKRLKKKKETASAAPLSGGENHAPVEPGGEGGAEIVDGIDSAQTLRTPSAESPTITASASESDDPATLRRRLEESLAREKRWLADLDNYRRRTERMFEDQAEARKRAMASDLLEVLDDFDRALEHAAEGEGGLGEGVEAMRDKMLGILARHGFKPFNPLHQPFDPTTQEALGLIHHPELEDQMVAHVLRIGWKAGEKLLRPAQVMVVKNA